MTGGAQYVGDGRESSTLIRGSSVMARFQLTRTIVSSETAATMESGLSFNGGGAQRSIELDGKDGDFPPPVIGHVDELP